MVKRVDSKYPSEKRNLLVSITEKNEVQVQFDPGALSFS